MMFASTAGTEFFNSIGRAESFAVTEFWLTEGLLLLEAVIEV